MLILLRKIKSRSFPLARGARFPQSGKNGKLLGCAVISALLRNSSIHHFPPLRKGDFVDFSAVGKTAAFAGRLMQPGLLKEEKPAPPA